MKANKTVHVLFVPTSMFSGAFVGLLHTPPLPPQTWCRMELQIELIESGIGSGLCWLFQNLASWPDLQLLWQILQGF